MRWVVIGLGLLVALGGPGESAAQSFSCSSERTGRYTTTNCYPDNYNGVRVMGGDVYIPSNQCVSIQYTTGPYYSSGCYQQPTTYSPPAYGYPPYSQPYVYPPGYSYGWPQPYCYSWYYC